MIDLQPATFEEFEREAARDGCNVMPVVRRVLADLQTPVGAFMRVAGGEPFAFLLESVEGGERVARHSFLGARPQLVVRGRGRDTVVERAGGEREVLAGVLVTDYLREHFRARRLAARPGLSPLIGGAVGFLSYEAAGWFEPTLEVAAPDADSQGVDDAIFMFYRTVLAFDRVRQQIEIASVVMTDEAGGSRERLRELYEAAVAETARVEELLHGRPPHPPSRAARPRDERSAKPQFVSNWERPDFEQAVGEIKGRIRAGDCYQAVLSQRFSAEIASATPLDVYRALRATNPSPYTYFLRLGETSIVGASPEMLVRCRGRQLEYRPIAGTRPRGEDEEGDARLAAELRADEKERAEHLMLVDLGRNDLGRVAEYGSVQVRELMTVERYSHVQHLVSSLTARLRDGADRFDALAACFPAGTVSGAPKVSAVRIVRGLEPTRRGVYAGSVLYADYAGNLDSCIAIRTVVLRGGRAEVQAGAGIVADSVPAAEYDETVNKARAVLRAVELAERGL